MLNSYQKQTKSGKPVINSITKLPVFERTVNQRINTVCSQLGIEVKHTKQGVKPQYNHDQRMDMIKLEMSLI